jgi:co-chaperonin GroES (HSP10)
MNNMIIPMEFNKERKRPNYDEAVSLDCPFDALMDRVIVVHIERESDRKKDTGIYIPEHVRNSMESAENHIVPGVIKSIGKGNERDHEMIPSLEMNDVVYTYPGAYEAKMIVGENEYLIYARRDILIKVKQ